MIGPGDPGFSGRVLQLTRLRVLGAALGVAVEDAQGRLEQVRRRAGELATEVLHDAEIEAWLGRGGADALVRAQFGQRLADGQVRIVGAEAYVRDFAQRRAAASRGGRKRAARAGLDARDARGRFTSRITSRVASRTAARVARALRKTSRESD